MYAHQDYENGRRISDWFGGHRSDRCVSRTPLLSLFLSPFPPRRHGNGTCMLRPRHKRHAGLKTPTQEAYMAEDHDTRGIHRLRIQLFTGVASLGPPLTAAKPPPSRIFRIALETKSVRVRSPRLRLRSASVRSLRLRTPTLSKAGRACSLALETHPCEYAHSGYESDQCGQNSAEASSIACCTVGVVPGSFVCAYYRSKAFFASQNNTP